MQTIDDQPYPLLVGTEVSAKYKGAFCEAKVRKVVRNIKCKVLYKQGLGAATVQDDVIKGQLRVGASVEVKHPDKKEFVEATITKIQDCSQYTVVFDDGDITTLRRTALCLKSGRHFNEMTLDELPLTNPEHFGNPVVGGGRRGRRSRHLQDDSSDEEEEEVPAKKKVQEKEENIGKVICVENNESKKKSKENWFPALVVAPTAQVQNKIKVKDEYLVRSFKDGRYYTVPKKEAHDFTREMYHGEKGAGVAAAIEFLEKDNLPAHWDRDALFGGSDNSSDYEQDYETDSSTDEPSEEKDHFVAQLYKFMDDRGTPLNKGPSIINRDVDLYRLFRTVQKLGGYNRVTTQNQWKAIAIRLGFTPATASITNLVKQAYKKFLHAFEEFNRKLGCTMISTPRNRPTKGRSLVRASSVASPRPKEEIKEIQKTTPSTSKEKEIKEEEDNANESSNDAITPLTKGKRKERLGKVKNLVEKFEEKQKEVEKIEKEEKEIKEEKQIKKEKVSKKPIEEKRNRKRKDSESSIKKEKELEPAPMPAASTKTTVSTTNFKIEIGDKLKVFYHEQKVTYEAKVLDIQKQEGENVYLVHYTGWNTRYDEWVRRDRIAENLSNTKQQKKGAKAAQKSANQGASPGTLKSAKRNRVNSKGEPPRSTTPLSSSAKSPATPVSSRRVATRGQPGTNRRTSNNTDASSNQSDSDTDSDEPIKKSAQRSTSSSAASTTKAIASDKSNVTESSDEFSNGTKGRDYDLNQIRSELKGFKDLKSDSPALESGITSEVVVKVKNEDISNLSTKSNLSPASTSDTIKSEVATKFSGVSSDSEEFGDGDESQSSVKTFGSDSLKVVASKLGEKGFGKLEKSSSSPAANKQTEKPVKPEKPVTPKQVKSKMEKKLDKTTPGKSSIATVMLERKNLQSLSGGMANIEKSIPKSVIEKSTAKTVSEKNLPKSPMAEISAKEQKPQNKPVLDESDIYEFKEPEPFEFEGTASGRKNLTEFTESEKKTKKRTLALAAESEARASSPSPVKKQKKSPAKVPEKEVKSILKQDESDEKLVSTSEVESAFDVLRKSPSFKPAKMEEVQEPPSSPKLINKSVFMNTNLESSPECILKSEKVGILRGKEERYKEHKISELESVKKILTDPTFEPPKIEKPSSIADKLLNALSQKTTEPETKSERERKGQSAESPLAFISKKPEMLKTSTAIITNLTEPPKIEIGLKPKEDTSVKPTLSTNVDTKLDDILESISPKNNELSETIQKLESVIQKTSQQATTPHVPDRYDDESDDSTDSEQSRLVIEDESQSSDPFVQQDNDNLNPNEIKTNIIIKDKRDVNIKYLQESFQESKLVARQYETPAVAKIVDQVLDTVSSSSVKPPDTKKEEPDTTAANEPISMLLCEETIPGSPASSGIKDPTENVRKVYADTGFLVPPSIGDRDDVESEFGKKGRGRETAENSPRGSYSQDDSKSDSERLAQDEFVPKKRKRQRKSSETESTSTKKRRGRAAANSSRNNGTDSDDNSDITMSQRVPLPMPSTNTGRSQKPCQYNFLVQLDAAMNSNQRIQILRKKIQDLQKTYNNIKQELASIERRRKKLRRREREKKNAGAKTT